jgi:uncharacterized protein YbaA (DUF1428 family)
MTYIEGFVIAVPTANKEGFIAHAKSIDGLFLEKGARAVVECWQDNVAKGHTTDFFGAVDCAEDESVAFSWVEWADKAARTAGMAEMDKLFEADPRFDPEKNPMPFDGTRMIFGCFEPVVEEGAHRDGGYVQGFIVPVPAGNKDAYRTAALGMWEIMKDYGAVRLIEAWQDDVPRGKQTDFFRAVKAEDGEIVVFSFIEWESREVCDSAHEKMMQDERMQKFMGENPDATPPFDGKRMVYGGFKPVVELSREMAGA